MVNCDFANNISKNRTFLMGIAMLLVLIYHALCVTYNPLRELNIGYVGVDIFLFLSGFGLTFSFINNKCLIFYKHRFIRLYPLYCICVFICFILSNNWRIEDLIYNLLTIGFYINKGVNRFDWYIESLFTLYLLFPLIFLYSKLKIWGELILLIAVVTILYLFKVLWWYDCFISRIPIFVFGIICARYNIVLCHKTIKWLVIIGILLFILCYVFISRFLAASFLVLPIFFIINLYLKYFNKRLIESCCYIGKHSLEIYLANVLILFIYDLYGLSRIECLITYLPFQILGSYILIIVNNKINRVVLKNK